MTAITFPNSPSSGDTHTAGNGIVYTYDGEKWTSIGTNSAGTWTRSGTSVSLTNAGDDLNVDSGTLFVDASTDRVGVGDTSPDSPLHVNGGTVNTVARFESTDSITRIVLKDNSGESRIGTNGDNITFHTSSNETERMRLDASGNLGIGTSTARAGLTVALGGDAIPAAGASTGSALFGNATDDGVYGVVLGANTSGVGYIQAQRGDGTAATYNLAIQPNGGNVGVGTSSPSVELSIAGNDPQLCLWEGTDGASSSKVQLGTGTAQGFINIHKGDGTRTVQINSDGTSYLNGGNVGIGTTSPRRQFHIHNSASATVGMMLTNANTGEANDSQGFQLKVGSDSHAEISQMENSHIGIFTNASERIRIHPTGAINISTNTSDSYYYYGTNYHVFHTDNDNVAAAVIENSGNTSPYGLLINFSDGNPNDNVKYMLECSTTAGVKAKIFSNGGFSNYQSNDSNLCDEREKKNIEPLDSTWGCLKHWELKKFHYNEDADTADKRYGVIAQQVAPHCPEVITDWIKQEAEEAKLDDDGNVVTPAQEEIARLGVKEQQMMWMAIKALQEAQDRIETLEAKVAALEAS